MPQHTTNKNIRKGALKQGSTGPTPFADAESLYAVAGKSLGDQRIMVTTLDGLQYIAHIPNKFNKPRYWITPGMYVLINKRSELFKSAVNDNRADIIYIFSPAEVKYLKRIGEIADDADEDPDAVQFEKNNDARDDENDPIKQVPDQPDRFSEAILDDL